ncbi:MFS general substrate transporter [Hypoxylon argillaceum]|nr:MFS general substrate transporter [Hypoxylon argillaceum]
MENDKTVKVLTIKELDVMTSDLSDDTNKAVTDEASLQVLAPAKEAEKEDEDGYGSSPKPYSIYTSRQKRFIVLAAAAGALVSPLTGNIYLPAIHKLAEEFGVSDSQINLTVTIYMIFQGLTPLLVGGFSDRAGRRPAFVACFVVYTAANLGLAMTPESYAALLVLRSLQSAGAATTQMVCQAVMADIVTSAERGQYIGYAMSPAALGPSLGPLLGGILAYYHGWRSIFWFLAAYGGIALVLLGLFFPETCRRLAGDGSVLPPKTNQTPWQLITTYRQNVEAGAKQQQDSTETERASILKTLIQPFKLAFQKELGILLLGSGLTYSGVYATTTPLSSLLGTIYGLNTLKTGLVFLPVFGGSVVAIALIGMLMNKNYRRHARKLGIDVSGGQKRVQMDLATFPIERARIEVVLLPLSLCIVAMTLWGWLLEVHVPLAVVCVLIFLLGFAFIGANNVLSGLIIDLNPGNAGSAASANNFVKFAFGAVVSAVIQPLILALGMGWTYTLLAAIYILILPILVLIAVRGQRWRTKSKGTAVAG